MMKRFMRSIGVIVGLGSTTVGVVPGCSNHLGPVVATQNVGTDRTRFPAIFVEKAKECVAEHGAKLPPGHLVLNSTVEVDEDGLKWDVTIDNVPETASDFGACMRIALQDLPIAESLLREGAEKLRVQRAEALAEQRRLVGHPVVIVVAGVTIVVSEVVLEAGAVTILLAVSVKVVEKAAKDIAEEGWKAKCAAHYAACMATNSARKVGNHLGQTRCGICARVCVENEEWPFEVGNGSCEYWKRGW